MVLMKTVIFKKNFLQEMEIFAQGNVLGVTVFAQTEGMKKTIISYFIISKVLGNHLKINPLRL